MIPERANHREREKETDKGPWCLVRGLIDSHYCPLQHGQGNERWREKDKRVEEMDGDGEVEERQDVDIRKEKSETPQAQDRTGSVMRGGGEDDHGDTDLHGDAEVHHGHAGVAVPADVHGGVAAVTLALQGRARAAELVLRLLLGHAVLRQLCGTRERSREVTERIQKKTRIVILIFSRVLRL